MRHLNIIQTNLDSYEVYEHYLDFAEATHRIIMRGTTRYNNVELFTLEVDEDLTEETLKAIENKALEIREIEAHYKEIKNDAHSFVITAIGTQLEKHRETLHQLIKTAKGA